jgi:hypothetical protein
MNESQCIDGGATCCHPVIGLSLSALRKGALAPRIGLIMTALGFL